LINQNAGPRDDYFVKQGSDFKGETADAPNGEKATQPAATKKMKAGTREANSHSERFAERDANHDHKIDWEEFLASASAKTGAKERFTKFDANKDGFVTPDEFNQGVAK
jgi:hypothetical protein